MPSEYYPPLPTETLHAYVEVKTALLDCGSEEAVDIVLELLCKAARPAIRKRMKLDEPTD